MPRPHRLKTWLAAIALGAAAVVAWFLLATPPIERTSGPLTHQAYVWQRRWDDAVLGSLADRGGSFDRIVPLGVEVEWAAEKPRIVDVHVDFASLAATGRSVGVALRIGPYPGPFAADDPVARQLCDIARSIVARAADAGVTLAELQVDFDAASSKLAGYRVWVQAIAAAVSPTPVAITTLPTWMNHRDFGPLVAAADSFVLQVHSIERPAGPDAVLTLCDTELARRWVDRAARFGRPFRVALPTYGYLVAFDPGGKYLGLSAVGSSRRWPADSVVRRVDADPSAIASLIEAWTASRPMLMQGVIWYRLPIRTDTLNWRWPTLAAVMAGRVPVAAPGAALRTVEPMLAEVDLVNTGEADAPARHRVRLSWADARLVAGDGAMGYTLTRDGPAAATLTPDAADLRLQRIGPGDTLTIAWLRFDQDTEVTVDVQPAD